MSERINLTRTPVRFMDINLDSTTGVQDVGDHIAAYHSSVTVYWDRTTPNGMLAKIRKYVQDEYGLTFESCRITKDMRKRWATFTGEPSA